jgi:heme/copper-type cytochrome/quinol oxidase subunit 3
MLSGDGLRYTTRNLIFMFLTIIIIGSFYGIYLDLNIKNEDSPLYLSLFIVSCIVFFGSLILLIYDSLTDRDLKMEKDSSDKRKREMETINARMPASSGEIPTTIIGKNFNYFNNSFEKTGNIWRTLYILMSTVIIYTSFVITYMKHSKTTRENPEYISAISLSSLAIAIHFIMLIYQLIEYSKLDKKSSIGEIRKFQKRIN